MVGGGFGWGGWLLVKRGLRWYFDLGLCIVGVDVAIVVVFVIL